MRNFTQTADAIGATTKKLEKLRLIADLLRSIDIEDAALAARFLSAHVFPKHDERTLGIGGSNLSRVIAEAAGNAGQSLGATYRKHGDLGDVAEELLRNANPNADISLAEVARLFDALSSARGPSQKAEILLKALKQASASDVKYLVKIITGDLRIGSKESLVEEAIARAFDRPLADVRRANMMIGDIGETLVLAAQDRLSHAAVRLFHPLGFMLAAPVETAADLFGKELDSQQSTSLLVEEKYDGIRAQIHKDKSGKVKIFSRTLDEVTEFPELVPAIRDFPGELILDGEILAWRDDRPLPFTELQKRLGRKNLDMFIQQDIPVKYVAFDLLYQDGELLLDEPLTKRRKQLATITAKASPAVRLATSVDCDSASAVESAFRNALAAGHEGIVAKAAYSPYTPGRRGGYWFKLKLPFATLDVVVTAAEYGHGKRHKVLSDYTFAIRDGEKLLNIGKAYSGLTDAEISEYTEYFLQHTMEDRGHLRIVEPTVVLEVAFNNIQKSSRHDSGYALRFPRIVRIRKDKTVEEIDTIESVSNLFSSQSLGTPSAQEKS
ncbi:MAG TPA: ATP-dependent DNA ligase [Candidatus Acidoferrum sp.]|nr:ATP-dependent DNA ligase [Candidatus Acidoferrum sp.]